MASRTALCLAALSLCVVLVSLSPTPATADTRVGRLGILCDVHGYRVGNYVVVPLRGIAEWLGAEVTYKKPAIELRRGKHLAKITLNKKTATVDGRQITLPTAPKAYDGITCAPLKLIAAAFGVDVEYKADRDDREVERMGGVAFVQIRSQEKRGRVVVHGTSPAVTAGILKAREEDDRYGIDWVMAGLRPLKHGYVQMSPFGGGWQDSETGFLCEPMGSVWKRSGSTWKYICSDGELDDGWVVEARQKGMPEDVIAQVKARVR